MFYFTCDRSLRPVESNAGVGDRDRATQKAPEWMIDTDIRTSIRPLDDDKFNCLEDRRVFAV